MHGGEGEERGREHRVVFAICDGFQTMDVAGPLDVLNAATLLGAEPAYDTLVVSLEDSPSVRAESGLTVTADMTAAQLVADSSQRVDTLVVAGGVRVSDVADDTGTVERLAALGQRAARIASVCNGAILLAATGLLDGYQATTHWAWCESLDSCHSEIQVLADRIFVHDRDRWSSAGVSAVVDLFVAIVEHDHGAELAHEIARWLVVFVRRPGGQSQLSTQLLAQPARSAPLDAVQRWLPDNLGEDLSVEGLARRAGMSPGHFARAWRAETGTTPAAYVEQLRVEAARVLLETSDLTVEVISRMVGMRRAETLYRAFRRQLNITPDRYRQSLAPHPNGSAPT